MKISGWIFDVYPIAGGMRVWIIDPEGRKHSLLDRFSPSFYIGGPPSSVRPLLSFLSRLNLPLQITPSEGIEFYSGKAIPVTRVRLADPVHFTKVVKWCTSTAIQPEGIGLSLYHCDLSLSQLYFYEKGSFPLAFCEVEIEEGTIREIHLLDSIWRTDYTTPPLSILTLRIEGEGIQPDHTGPRRLEVVVDGRTTCLEAEDEAGLVDRFDRLLLRHDPDLILSEWGDSYILPRLIAMAKKRHFPLLLNREPEARVITRRERSYYTYGQVVHQAQSHLLLGRWHIDLHNSFLIGHTELEGLFEFARLSKIPVQQMARTTTGTGITSMQMDLAFQDGILIPWRKQETEGFKSADHLLLSDKGGLTYTPKLGFHEDVAELDFASMYPSLMARYNISPETINCSCCWENLVPEIGHHLCTKRKGLIPRFLTPFLAKRAEYKRLKKTATDPIQKKIYDDRQSALKWGLVTTFGYQGYKNARFGKIEAHEAITAYSREKLLQAKEIVESEGFEMIHAIVDSLWIRKSGTTETDYETLAERISKACEIPIALEGIYRWVLFPPSKSDPKFGVPNRYFGVFRNGEVKLRGIEARRGDTCPFIRTAQIEMIKTLSQAKNRKEYQALLPQVEEIREAYRERLKTRRVSMWELAIAKTITKSPREYQKESLTAIVAKELAGRGVRLSPGQSITYVITDAKSRVKSERARALGFLDGSFGFDAEKYESLLTQAAEVLFLGDLDLFHQETLLP
ncbi:MAG: DNA polymerase domain-containing protein [Candidatus Manganitrophaceae bacterium]